MTPLSTGVVARAAAAALVPLAIVSVIAWPTRPGPDGAAADPSTGGAAPAQAPLDTSAVRKAALDLVAAARSSTSAREPASTGEPDRSASRIEALGLLTARIYAARDARRKEGKAGAELRKAFTIDELGGADLVKELALGATERQLVLRDGGVLWPVGGKLPADLDFGANNKGHAVEARATVNGAPVVAVRFCPYGEVTCLIDFRPAAPAPVAAPGSATAEPAAPDPAALDAALLALANARPTQEAPAVGAPAPNDGAGRTGFFLALFLGLAAAMAGLVVVAAFTMRAARGLVAAQARLLQTAAGRAPDAAQASSVRELAALQDAITAAARGVADAATRLATEDKRRARADAVGQALAQASGNRDLSARIAVDDVDDAALMSVVDGANRLLESLDRQVLRWQSHVAAVGPRAQNARDLEARAEALRPLAPLLSETSQRVLRLALIDGTPARVVDELRSLGEALGERGRTAQAALDALLLDLATEQPQARHSTALSLLQQELRLVKTSQTAPDRVAALQDLPPAEIGERVAADRA